MRHKGLLDEEGGRRRRRRKEEGGRSEKGLFSNGQEWNNVGTWELRRREENEKEEKGGKSAEHVRQLWT